MAVHFRASILLLSLILTHAYPNGAPNARLPTLGWSSWIALGPAGSPPVFDFCDEASVKASADAFIALGLYDAGYRHFHLRVRGGLGEESARVARAQEESGARGEGERRRAAEAVAAA